MQQHIDNLRVLLNKAVVKGGVLNNANEVVQLTTDIAMIEQKINELQNLVDTHTRTIKELKEMQNIIN